MRAAKLEREKECGRVGGERCVKNMVHARRVESVLSRWWLAAVLERWVVRDVVYGRNRWIKPKVVAVVVVPASKVRSS